MRASMEEQLSRLNIRRPQKTTPTIYRISQIAFQINQRNTISEVREEILKWIAKRAGAELPARAWEGKDFRLDEVQGQPVEVIAFDHPVNYWAAQVKDADKEVAQRSWVAEAALAVDGEKVLFATRLSCVTRGPTEAAISRTIPGFVRQIADNFAGELDGRPIGTKPWIINTEDQVERLVSLINSPERRHKILVFSVPEGSESADETIFPVRDIAERVLGVAHVAIITSSAGFCLSDHVGKEFSVYRQAVRTYNPGVNLEEAPPYAHPFALPDKIRQWNEDGVEGFKRDLVEKVLASTIARNDLEHELPTFSQVRRYKAQSDRKIKDKSTSMEKQLEAANRALAEVEGELDQQKKEYDELLETAEDERDLAQVKLEQKESQVGDLRREGYDLRERTRYLMSSLTDSEGSTRVKNDEDDYPALSEIGQWAREHLSGSVLLHNRAIRSAKKSPFEDVALVYNSLLMLRDYYVPMRRGEKSPDEFKDACGKLGLDETPCFAGTGYGSEGEDYFVQYSGHRCKLDRHLKGSNNRTHRFGFRLYFFWDDDSGQVIVGSLPRHLETRAS